MVTKIPPNSPKFVCEKCHIKTNNKKDFTIHLMTAKHLKNSLGDSLGDRNGGKLMDILNNKKEDIFKCDNCDTSTNTNGGNLIYSSTTVKTTTEPEPEPVEPVAPFWSSDPQYE